MLSLLLTVAMTVVTPVEDKVPYSETYPLDVCAVAGKKLGSMGKPIDFVHEGRQVRFCCRGCVPKFKANPEQYLAEVDKKIVEAQKKSYPIDYCVLSNEKLDESAKDVVYNNRLIRLCCGGCVRKLNKDPQSIVKKLDSAITKVQTGNYPLAKCVISDENLGENYKRLIVGNTLIKICCKGCVPKVLADPSKYIKKVQSAKKAAAKEKKASTT